MTMEKAQMLVDKLARVGALPQPQQGHGQTTGFRLIHGEDTMGERGMLELMEHSALVSCPLFTPTHSDWCLTTQDFLHGD